MGIQPTSPYIVESYGARLLRKRGPGGGTNDKGKVYDHHQTLSARAGLPRLRPGRARLFASKSRSNSCAFPGSPLGSHVLFQRIMYSIFNTVSLLPSIFMISHSCSSACAVSLCVWTCSRPGGVVAGPRRMVGYIMEFGLDTLRLRRSAVGLGVEILILDRKYVICGMLDGPITFRLKSTSPGRCHCGISVGAARQKREERCRSRWLAPSFVFIRWL